MARDFCSEDNFGTYYLITFNPSSLPQAYNQILIAKELQTMVEEITQSIKYLFDCRVEYKMLSPATNAYETFSGMH